MKPEFKLKKARGKVPLHNPPYDPDPEHTAEALDLMNRSDAIDWKQWTRGDCTLTQWYRVPTWIEDVFLKPKAVRQRIIEGLDKRFGLRPNTTKTKPSGRPRKHKSNAARQKDYRKRRKQAKSVTKVV